MFQWLVPQRSQSQHRVGVFLSSGKFWHEIPPISTPIHCRHASHWPTGPADFSVWPRELHGIKPDVKYWMSSKEKKKKLLLGEPSGSVMNKFRPSHVIAVLLTPHTPFQILQLKQPWNHAGPSPLRAPSAEKRSLQPLKSWNFPLCSEVFNFSRKWFLNKRNLRLGFKEFTASRAWVCFNFLFSFFDYMSWFNWGIGAFMKTHRSHTNKFHL